MPCIPSINDSETESFEYKFWADEQAQRSYDRWRNAENSRLLADVVGSRRLGNVLEIGFGEGPLTSKMLGTAAEYWGVEPVPASFERTAARLRLDKKKIRNCTIEELIASEEFSHLQRHFDTIILVSVFEHISNPKEVLIFCESLLSASGRIIVSTPDSTFLRILTLLREMLGMEPWTRFHISFFSRLCLEKLTETCGLKILKKSQHSLITSESAKYFGDLYHSKSIEFLMRCASFLRLDRAVRIQTLLLTLDRKDNESRCYEVSTSR